MKEKYFRDGYYLAKRCIPAVYVNDLLNSMRDIFGKVTSDISDSGIIRLFTEDFNKFYGAANICQWLIKLFKFSTIQEISSLLLELGIANPVMNTRPLVSYSSKKLAKNDTYWKVPAHQDWPSTQGSLNGLTLWIPLVDIKDELGPLEVVPGSHVLGNSEHVEVEGVPVLSRDDWNFLPVPMDVGDVLVFSNFLIHKSGINLTEDEIRWSAHFRYDDACESTFIERNFPHHRTDKRLPGLLHPTFPTKEVLANFFKVTNGLHRE